MVDRSGKTKRKMPEMERFAASQLGQGRHIAVAGAVEDALLMRCAAAYLAAEAVEQSLPGLVEAESAYVARHLASSVQRPEAVADLVTAGLVAIVAVAVAAVDQGVHTGAGAGIVHSEDCMAVVEAHIRELSDLEEAVVQRLHRAAEARHLGCARQCGQGQRPGSAQRRE